MVLPAPALEATCGAASFVEATRVAAPSVEATRGDASSVGATRGAAPSVETTYGATPSVEATGRSYTVLPWCWSLMIRLLLSPPCTSAAAAWLGQLEIVTDGR